MGPPRCHLQTIKHWANHQYQEMDLTLPRTRLDILGYYHQQQEAVQAPPRTRLDVLGYHHQYQEVVQEHQLQALHGGQGESQKGPRWELLSLMNRVDGVKNCQQEKVEHLKQEVERQFQGDTSLKDKEIYGLAFKCDSLPYLKNPSGVSSKVGQSASGALSPGETHKEEMVQSSFGISACAAVINCTDTTSSLENKVR